MTNPKILLATSETHLAAEIEKQMTAAGFSVVQARDAQESIQILKRDPPEAFLIDWELSRTHLDEINRLLQETCRKTALVILSDSRRLAEKVQALEEGADECLSRSDALGELTAKIRALMRRIDRVENTPRTLRIKDIEINLDSHEVLLGGKPLDLTYTQFKLLYLLVTHRDTVFSREEILEKIWGDGVLVTDRTVDVHVKRLREKLGEKSHPSHYIQTIHGLGYRFG
jgi:DNA-binding response OmpR family regulator